MPSFGCLVASIFLPLVAREFRCDRYSIAECLTPKCSRIFGQEKEHPFFLRDFAKIVFEHSVNLCWYEHFLS